MQADLGFVSFINESIPSWPSGFALLSIRTNIPHPQIDQGDRVEPVLLGGVVAAANHRALESRV